MQEKSIVQVALGFTGIDLLGDARDLTYDVIHFKFTKKHIGQTTVDIMSVISIIGSVKNIDEVGALAKAGLKNSDEIVDTAKAGLKNVGEIADSAKAGLKNIDEVADAVEGTVKSGDGLANIASDVRTNHILYGDKTGGGHLWPGQSGKSVFPKRWDAKTIMHNISEIATDPTLTWNKGRIVNGVQRYEIIGIRDGVKVKVITDGKDIITAFPIN